MLKLKHILCVPLSVDVKVDNTCCVCLSVLMLKLTTHAMMLCIPLSADVRDNKCAVCVAQC